MNCRPLGYFQTDLKEKFHEENKGDSTTTIEARDRIMDSPFCVQNIIISEVHLLLLPWVLKAMSLVLVMYLLYNLSVSPCKGGGGGG